MYKIFNPNPYGSRVGDCVVRAVSKVMNKNWPDAYMDLCLVGLTAGDMPSSNAVWGKYLRSKGFEKHIIPDSCPVCMTVKEFLADHKGTYVLCTGSHAVAAVGGDYYDSWDSGDEVPLFYWEKGEE